jgi:molybdopterin adenylyltransferase
MRVAILTISDSVSSGKSEDRSGAALQAECAARGMDVVHTGVLADDDSAIRARLSELCDSGTADLILTTGGTGLGPRDVTPEATQAVAERLVPGLPELMRRAGYAANPRAALSRGVAALRGNSLIVNLPGSPEGAVESFYAIAGVLAHAIDVIHGARHDAGPKAD